MLYNDSERTYNKISLKANFGEYLNFDILIGLERIFFTMKH